MWQGKSYNSRTYRNEVNKFQVIQLLAAFQVAESSNYVDFDEYLR